ncbi:phosphoribosylanthranilate isomerase [Pedobacter sp. MW01-1-1]|uniref:phosphoribosylanthranilate isomerase n=1 Tax=Pedobacter sp. MW01-1-1 TaxID=3383027 RepID=UPI003FEE8FD2
MIAMDLKLKVCGMKYANNIAEVAELRPDYLGFIFYRKSPRFISSESAELIKYIPSEIKTTGVFVNEELGAVLEHVAFHQLKAVQLHGDESVTYCEALKSYFPGVEIIKAFGLNDEFDFALLEPYMDKVDYFLFDTKTPAHGGSGQTFNWEVLAKYPYDKPYFLSGGLDVMHADEIKNLTDSHLYAVDINSKFELEPGLKDAAKIRDFIAHFETKDSLSNQ